VVMPNCHRDTSSASIRLSSVAVSLAYDRE
jgi:hypothetical protein